MSYPLLRHLIFFTILLILPVSPVLSETRTIASILLPTGFIREKLPEGSFQLWLRSLELKAQGSSVHLFNGELKNRQDVHEAVIDREPGNRDLQQCADALMRLRSEYLYQRGDFTKIRFTLASGLDFPYSSWIQGYRLVVKGNKSSLVKSAAPGNDPKIFQAYLTMLYAYAGSLSLEKDVKKPKVTELSVGDIFLKGGSPGHGVMVVDKARHPKTGEVIFLLAQSYMPAQEIHILKNPDSTISPWYRFKSSGDLNTPEWRFDFIDRRVWD